MPSLGSATLMLIGLLHSRSQKVFVTDASKPSMHAQTCIEDHFPDRFVDHFVFKVVFWLTHYSTNVGNWGDFLLCVPLSERRRAEKTFGVS